MYKHKNIHVNMVIADCNAAGARGGVQHGQYTTAMGGGGGARTSQYSTVSMCIYMYIHIYICEHI